MIRDHSESKLMAFGTVPDVTATHRSKLKQHENGSRKSSAPTVEFGWLPSSSWNFKLRSSNRPTIGTQVSTFASHSDCSRAFCWSWQATLWKLGCTLHASKDPCLAYNFQLWSMDVYGNLHLRLSSLRSPPGLVGTWVESSVNQIMKSKFATKHISSFQYISMTCWSVNCGLAVLHLPHRGLLTTCRFFSAFYSTSPTSPMSRTSRTSYTVLLPRFPPSYPFPSGATPCTILTSSHRAAAAWRFKLPCPYLRTSGFWHKGCMFLALLAQVGRASMVSSKAASPAILSN